MSVVQAYSVDMTTQVSSTVCWISQGDVGLRMLEFDLYAGALAYYPAAGSVVRLEGMLPNGDSFRQDGTIVGTAGSSNVVTFDVDAEMSAVAGVAYCQIVEYSNARDPENGYSVASGKFRMVILTQVSPDASSKRWYYYYREIPEGELKDTADKLIARGILNGRGGSGDTLIVDLGNADLRLLVLMDRAGLFDNIVVTLDQLGGLAFGSGETLVDMDTVEKGIAAINSALSAGGSVTTPAVVDGALCQLTVRDTETTEDTYTVRYNTISVDGAYCDPILTFRRPKGTLSAKNYSLPQDGTEALDYSIAVSQLLEDGIDPKFIWRVLVEVSECSLYLDSTLLGTGAAGETDSDFTFGTEAYPLLDASEAVALRITREEPVGSGKRQSVTVYAAIQGCGTAALQAVTGPEWTGTQAEYDALGSYDSGTTYYIVEAAT